MYIKNKIKFELGYVNLTLLDDVFEDQIFELPKKSSGIRKRAHSYFAIPLSMLTGLQWFQPKIFNF